MRNLSVAAEDPGAAGGRGLDELVVDEVVVVALVEDRRPLVDGPPRLGVPAGDEVVDGRLAARNARVTEVVRPDDAGAVLEAGGDRGGRPAGAEAGVVADDEQPRLGRVRERPVRLLREVASRRRIPGGDRDVRAGLLAGGDLVVVAGGAEEEEPVRDVRLGGRAGDLRRPRRPAEDRNGDEELGGQFFQWAEPNLMWNVR